MEKVETLKLLIETLRTDLLVLETILVGAFRTPYCIVCPSMAQLIPSPSDRSLSDRSLAPKRT